MPPAIDTGRRIRAESPAPNSLDHRIWRGTPQLLSPMHSPEVYLANRELIDDAIAAVCRRRRLPPDEADDFASDARLHLIKDDYAVLRAFQERSSLRTFLFAVLSHLFLDWRNARWGKWRPSAEAKRMGPEAVRLETLMSRDRLSFEEACETMRAHHGVTASRAELEAIAARFPHRPRRAFTSDDGLDSLPAGDGAADDLLVKASAAAAASRARVALGTLMSELAAQDRLILQMRFTDGHRIQDIARMLHLDAKPLYRRIERLLADLRRGLESRGVTAVEAREAIEHEGFLAESDAPPAESRGGVRPFPREAPSPAVSEGRRP